MANSRYTYDAAGNDVEMINNPDGTQTSVRRPSGYTASKNNPEPVVAAAPSVTPAATPTRYTSNNAYDTEAAKFKEDAKMPDEAAIRADKLKEAQGLIDAINNKYAAVFANDEVNGRAAMGSTRSAAARGGLLGSDFGNGQLDRTTANNKKIIDADQANKNLELASIFDKVDQRTQEAITAKRNEALTGRNNYLAYLKENRDQARTDFVNIAKTKTLKSLDELSTEDYQKLLDQTGYDDATAKLVFNSNRPAAQKIDYQYKIEGNKLFAYGVNPETGQLSEVEKDLGFEVPKDYTPTTLPDGTLIFSPKTIDPSKPLKDQVLMYGSEGQFEKETKKTGSGTNSDTKQADRAAVAADIAAITGTDGKLDTAKFQKIREGVSVNSPDLLSWFDKTYDPDIVLNPNDPTNPYKTSKAKTEKTNQEILKDNKDSGMTREEAKASGFNDADIEAIYGAKKSWLKSLFNLE